MANKSINNACGELLTFIVSCLMLLIRKISSENAEHTARKLLPELEAMISCSKTYSPYNETELPELARSFILKTIPKESWGLIPSLRKNKEAVKNTWEFQNNVMAWDIGQHELVLDVGFGGWPFKRADHLADRYQGQTSHRAEALALDGRPFFEVDIEKMVFDDHAYDYVFCSHVLEHLSNPGNAIRELMRVGKRGYIEVPTRLSDVMFNFTRLPNHHRWHGLVLDETLVLIEWNSWERRDLGNHFFDMLHSKFENKFQDFFNQNRDLFFVSYHWTDEIKYLIIDKHGTVIDTSDNTI